LDIKKVTIFAISEEAKKEQHERTVFVIG